MKGSLRAWLRRTITYRWARRIVVAMIGGTILLIGIAMVVLPGPAIIVVPLGLGVLGLEFAFARHWLRKLRVTATDVVNRVRDRGRQLRGMVVAPQPESPQPPPAPETPPPETEQKP